MDGAAATTDDPRLLMDRMYRLQRHIYDPTRRYYLLGRDRAIAAMALAPGQRVLEIGCGTGWNLVRLARRYPEVSLVGVDASAAMLQTAGQRLAAAGLVDRVQLVHGLAEEYQAPGPVDAVLFSYALSMIPSWQPAIGNAIANLRPGGIIHVVDFWDQAELPRWFQGLLKHWLALFHVHHRPAVLAEFRRLAEDQGATLVMESIARRYAYRLEYRKHA